MNFALSLHFELVYDRDIVLGGSVILSKQNHECFFFTYETLARVAKYKK